MDGAAVSGIGAAEPKPKPRKGREYLTIQALRFVAALMVVLVHSTFYTHERLDRAMTVYSLGSNGVRLFFVISGFVMIMSSQKLLTATHGWRVFALKRILRIVPLYWCILLFKTAALLGTTGLVLHAKVDWLYIVKSFFFVPAYNVDGEIKPLLGVGWTLNFEMFFYLLFTCALALRLRPVTALAPVLIGLSALSLVRTDAWPVPVFSYCDPIVLDFLAGMAIARWAQTGRALPVLPSAVAVAVGLLYLFLPVDRPVLPQIVHSLLTTTAASLVIIGAVSLEPRIGARMPRAALFMGAASYSLYLVHPLTAPSAPQIFAKIHLDVPDLAIVASLVIALCAGAFCYRFIETPLSRFADGWAKRRGLLDPGGAVRPAPVAARTVPGALEREGA